MQSVVAIDSDAKLFEQSSTDAKIKCENCITLENKYEQSMNKIDTCKITDHVKSNTTLLKFFDPPSATAGRLMADAV